MARNSDWLALITEETLEADMPICDPHHHLWEFRHERVADRYLMDDIQADLNAGHNIVSTVFIECGAMYKADGDEAMKVIGETEFVNGIAAMSASGLYGKTRVAAGIIGTANLTLGAPVGDVLDAQIAAGGGRFRGIRHGVTWDASDEIPNARTNPVQHLYLDATFRDGFAQLASRDLTFEGWCYHPQIAGLTDLARAFPDTTIILNHFGGPLCTGPYAGKREEIFESWSRDIAALAACDNVMAKLGGLNMEFNGFGWENRPKPPTSQELVDATQRYFDYTIERFGVERCMFESNFPVDMVSFSYNILWNSFKKMTAARPAADREKLFHGTAARIYRLS